METKFTQGKWEIEPTRALNKNGNPLYYDIVSDRQLLSSTHKNKFIEGLGDEQQLANAKLIASAPEMFEMLKDVLDCNNRGFFEHINFNEIEQLLTKITK